MSYSTCSLCKGKGCNNCYGIGEVWNDYDQGKEKLITVPLGNSSNMCVGNFAFKQMADKTVPICGKKKGTIATCGEASEAAKGLGK